MQNCKCIYSQEMFWAYFSHRRQWEGVSECLASVIFQDNVKKVHFFLVLPRILRQVTWLGERKRLAEQETELKTKCIRVIWILHKYFEDSIRKLTNELLGISHLGIPNSAPWAPPVIEIFYLSTTPPYGKLTVHDSEGNKYAPLQMDSKHIQNAIPTLWD